MRIELKDAGFYNFLLSVGASYIENDSDEDEQTYGVFMMPKKCGDDRVAIKLRVDGTVAFGTIDEDCKNFDRGMCSSVFPEEQKWIIETLQKLQEYKKKRGKKNV